MILKIKTSGDYLQAYITVSEDETNAPVMNEDITELLEKHSVVYGIKEDVIETLTGVCEPLEDMIIAEGLPPTAGDNAEVRILKHSKKLEDIPPRTNEEGDVDYISPREGWIVPIKEGEELAVKVPPTQGDPGISVLNQEVPGLWGKDFNLGHIGGNNTIVRENSLIAEKDGLLVEHGDKLNVDESFKIYDDIGPHTGSIDIPLEYKIGLVISKDVKSGYNVKAHKIVIGGCLEDSEIEANDLVVKQGIVGVSDLPIRAEKIEAGYINGSRTIYCDSIKVLREVSSGAKIFCAQIKAGTIQGSTVTAAEAIWTDFMNGRNKILVGINYLAKQIVERCTNELIRMEKQHEQIKIEWRNFEKKMVHLKDLARTNPKHPLVLKELPELKKVKERHDQFLDKKKDLEEEKKKAQDKMYTFEDPFLLVRNGFSKDTSSNEVVDPDTVINFRGEIRKDRPSEDSE